MQTENVKRELVFAAKWLFGMFMLLVLVSVVHAQTVQAVNLGHQGLQARALVVRQVELPDYVRTSHMGIQEQLVRLPDWNGVTPMFHPSPVVVFIDEPVDVMWIRRGHSGYRQVGPKLWKRSGR